MIFRLILLTLLSYLIGNLNWALLISKLKKQDIRSMGSGNPGTLNMSRNFGLKIGLLTFFLDIMKGAIPTLIAFFAFKGKVFKASGFSVSEFAIYLCGLSVVLGHIYPVVLKFKGGKGIASTIGVFIVCSAVSGWQMTIVSIMALVAAGVFIYVTEFGAMGSFIATTPQAIACLIRLFVLNNAIPSRQVLLIITNILILLICFFTWFAHRKNIQRMLSGDEHPTSIKKMVVKMKAKKLSEQNALIFEDDSELSVKKQVEKTIYGE